MPVYERNMKLMIMIKIVKFKTTGMEINTLINLNAIFSSNSVKKHNLTLATKVKKLMNKLRA